MNIGKEAPGSTRMTNSENEMQFDEYTEMTFQIIFKCAGTGYEPFHIHDADDRLDKRICFFPFIDINECKAYDALGDDAKNNSVLSQALFSFTTHLRKTLIH